MCVVVGVENRKKIMLHFGAIFSVLYFYHVTLEPAKIELILGRRIWKFPGRMSFLVKELFTTTILTRLPLEHGTLGRKTFWKLKFLRMPRYKHAIDYCMYINCNFKSFDVSFLSHFPSSRKENEGGMTSTHNWTLGFDRRCLSQQLNVVTCDEW